MSLPNQSHTRRRLAALFSVPFGFSIVFFLVTTFSDRIDLDLQRIQNLSSCVNRLHATSSDIETGEHGFLLTGGDPYLIALEAASTRLPNQLVDCRGATRDQSQQLRALVMRLSNLVAQQAQQASRVLRVFHESGGSGAMDLVNSEESVQLAKQTRRSVEDVELALHQAESALLAKQRRWNQWSYLIFVIGTLGMVLVMMRLYQAATTYLHGRDLLQKQLHDLNVALEGEVEARTRDLKAANEELQQFAYVASHDLQEPLRTITSFTQLLESRYRGKLDEDADEFIGYIVTASRRMTDLINGLLALARLRKSGQSAAPVDLSMVVEEVRDNLAAAIRESGATLKAGALPSLVVDRVQISQLLQNLISNAIKYRRPEVPPVIDIYATREEGEWVLRVQDNGCGFEQRFAERIFGLFQRLPDRERVDGTGIGLSIARKIVERHGGRIWAESRQGAGSTFFVSLPASLEITREASQKPLARAMVTRP